MRFQSQFAFCFILIQETGSNSDFCGKREKKKKNQPFDTQAAWIIASSWIYILDQILTVKNSLQDEAQMFKAAVREEEDEVHATSPAEIELIHACLLSFRQTGRERTRSYFRNQSKIILLSPFYVP